MTEDEKKKIEQTANKPEVKNELANLRNSLQNKTQQQGDQSKQIGKTEVVSSTPEQAGSGANKDQASNPSVKSQPAQEGASEKPGPNAQAELDRRAQGGKAGGMPLGKAPPQKPQSEMLRKASVARKEGWENEAIKKNIAEKNEKQGTTETKTKDDGKTKENELKQVADKERGLEPDQQQKQMLSGPQQGKEQDAPGKNEQPQKNTMQQAADDQRGKASSEKPAPDVQKEQAKDTPGSPPPPQKPEPDVKR
jgi:hypothetical protein